MPPINFESETKITDSVLTEEQVAFLTLPVNEQFTRIPDMTVSEIRRLDDALVAELSRISDLKELLIHNRRVIRSGLGYGDAKS